MDATLVNGDTGVCQFMNQKLLAIGTSLVLLTKEEGG